MAITTQMRTDVANLYVALFGRAPERDGLGYWVQQLDAGKTVAQVAQEMYNTDPARASYPTFLTNDEIVGRFYTNVLGRTADADGLAYWSAKLTAGATQGTVISEMITAVQSYAGTDTAAVASKDLLANKVTVGLYYAVDLGGNSATNTAIAGVTADAATVVTAKAAAAGTISSGSAFALTSSVDTPALTTGNDTISGVTGDATAANNSYTLGDNIADSSTTDSDTLNLTLVGTTASPVVTVANVETINLSNSGAGAHTFNAVNVSGASLIKATVSTAGDTETISNVASLSTKIGLAGKGNVTGTWAASLLTGTADTVEVSIAGVGTSATVRSTVTVSNTNAVEAVKVATTGTNYFDIDGGTAAATFTITGDGANTIGAFTGAGSLTVDASAATGKQTLTVSGLGLGDVVKGGTGTTDTLKAALATATTSLPTVSGFETLSLGFDAAATYNASKTTDVTTVTLTDWDGFAATVSELAASAATINLQETTADTNTVTVSYATGAAAAHTVNVGATDSTSTNVVVNMGNVVVSGNKAALTITSGGEAANSIDALTANSATSLTFDALTKGLTQTGAASATSATAVTYNATAGSLSIAAGNTLTATKAETFTVNATGGAVAMATILSDANVSAVTITASGNETNDVTATMLDVDHVSAITISADTGADVTISDIEMLGVDSATTPADLSTSLTINATHADSVVTISDLSPAANAVLDSVVISGAGDVNIGTGTALDANIDITTLNASGLTGSLTFVGTSINAAMTVLLGNAGTSDTNTVTTGSGNDVITGGSGADVIVGGAGDDVISVGGGADQVTGGAGADNIDLGASDSKADTVIFDQTTGADTIVNFVAGTDIAKSTITNVTTAVNAVAAARANTTAFEDNDVTVISQTAGAAAAITTGGTATITDFTNVTQVLAYLDEQYTIAIGDVGVVVMNNGTNSYAYYVGNVAADTTWDAGDVTLIGTFNNAILTSASWTV